MRTLRQRSSGEECEQREQKGAMSPALFFPLSSLSLTFYPGNAPPPPKLSNEQKKNSPAALRSFPALGEDPLFCDTPAVLKGGAAAAAGNANAAAGGGAGAAAAAAPASKATGGRPPRSRATGGAAAAAAAGAAGAPATSAAAAAGLSPCPFSHDAFFRTVHALTGEFDCGLCLN